MARERRLTFGEVADLYDRRRPSYPAALVGDLIELAGVRPGQAVLEVGAGTGKATVMFAARGLPVVAVEPDPAMAAVAQRNCAPYPDVEIELGDFEEWVPSGRRFPLVFAAQSWHWVAPAVGYVKARAVLTPGGVLAAFWNRPRWDRSELRAELAALYSERFPDLDREAPMHPMNEVPPEGYDDWKAQIGDRAGLAPLPARSYEWTETYAPGEYAELIGSLSETLLLGQARRRELLASIEQTIEGNGGSLTMSYATRLCLARAV
jgi:SAM-dependent methyltransferase